MLNVVYYGFAGPDQMYRPVQYEIENPFYYYDLVQTMKQTGAEMAASKPNIREVYMVTQRHDVKTDFRSAIRSNSIEGFAIFRDHIKSIGVPVYPDK